MSLPSNTIAVVFALSTVLLADQVNRHVPLPYLDEIFHAPQARLYCSQPFHSLSSIPYDPKLTTPPGLYLLSTLAARVLPGIECHDIAFLRSTNLVMLLILPYIVSAIIELNQDEHEQRQAALARANVADLASLPPSYKQSTGGKRSLSRSEIRQLQQKAKEDKAAVAPPPSQQSRQPSGPRTDPLKDILSKHTVQSKLRARTRRSYPFALAHTIAFLPPLYFFAFLYYTDVGSVFFVLSCLLAVKKGALWQGSLLGAASILFRQTNIVWVLFAFATAALHQISLQIPELYNPIATDDDATDTLFITQLIRSVTSIVRLVVLANTKQLQDQRKRFVSIAVRSLTPLLPLLAGFAYFVHWNGGIVLGDKSNHQVGLHVPQLWYFLIFATIFGWAALLRAFSHHATAGPIKLFSASTKTFLYVTIRGMCGSISNAATSLILAALIVVSIHKFTIHHPFLLADNRHYTFYVWRKFCAHRLIPFALVPVYTTLLCAWTTALRRQGRSVLWITAFAGCTAATLIPSPLVEPRYFLIPYLLLRIHIQPSDVDAVESESKQTRKRTAAKWIFLAWEFVTALLINCVTIYLFLRKPFTWPETGVDTSRNESTTMRFMW